MHDELKPVSKSFKDPFGGWGASLVDGLSTLLVMGLEDEFREALPELEKIEFHAYDGTVSVFESIIRYMGGLLSAYELSNEQYPILLQKADELGQVLLPAFDTTTGLPTHEWNPVKYVLMLLLPYMTFLLTMGCNVVEQRHQAIQP